MSSNLMTQLAEKIAKNTAVINDFLQAQKLPAPSWDADAKPLASVLPSELAAAQAEVVDATFELHHLLLGPAGSVASVGQPADVFVLAAINRFKIADHVPNQGDISFQDLAAACGLHVNETRRIVRLAMANFIFRELREGYVSHTSSSAFLRSSSPTNLFVQLRMTEIQPAVLPAVDALESFPGSQEPTESGWALANNAKKPMFEELSANHPERAARMARLMDLVASQSPTEPLVDNFPWASLEDGTVVDVGGGRGPVCVALAREFPKLNFVLQDLASTVAEASSRLSPELVNRIRFEPHDFFTEQPVKNADVYFFRAVFHNWPDKYCTKILRSLIPALKPGARVLINETLTPRPGEVAPGLNRARRRVDLNMLLFFNAPERGEEEYARLFKEADPRFEFRGISRPAVNKTSVPTHLLPVLVEAVWRG